MSLAEHYEEWRTQREQMKDPNESYVNDNFTLVNYPWILDTQSKSEVLMMEYRDSI